MKKQGKKFYVGKKKQKNALQLTPGIKGFLISCNVEPKAAREALNLLNEYSGGISLESYEDTKSLSDPIDAMERQSDDIRELNNRFQMTQFLPKVLSHRYKLSLQYHIHRKEVQ
ncbi:hypothetical protein MXB_1922 [Myxobolus squamalis]|nr:hypothetical protein MXB_1922 [Myxobolus squamalis]